MMLPTRGNSSSAAGASTLPGSLPRSTGGAEPARQKTPGYAAFGARGRSAAPAMPARMIWRSLPLSAHALVLLVLGEAALWVAGVVASGVTGCAWGIGRVPTGGGCLPVHWQVTASTLAAQLAAVWLLVGGAWGENADQLVAGAVVSMVAHIVWFVFETCYVPRLPIWSWAIEGTFAASMCLKLLLLVLVQRRMGWRVHSRVSCDLRRKHAAFERDLRLRVERLRALMRIGVCAAAINAASCLGLTVAAWLPSPAGAPLSALPRAAVVSAFGTAGLTVAALGWIAAAWLAVWRGRRWLEIAVTVSMLPLLAWPAELLWLTLDPAMEWGAGEAVRAVLSGLPAVLWVATQLAVWWQMRSVLAALRSPEAKELLAVRAADGVVTVSEAGASEIPDQLQPLLRGAWLIKASGDGAAPSRARSFVRGKRWRYFQLSCDLTTLRWSEHKYVLIYHVESLQADCDALTLRLETALDPPLCLCCEDAKSFDEWESGLRLLLALVNPSASGAAPLPAPHVAVAAAGGAMSHAVHHGLVKAALEIHSNGGDKAASGPSRLLLPIFAGAAGMAGAGSSGARNRGSGGVGGLLRGLLRPRASVDDPTALRLRRAQAWAERSAQLFAAHAGPSASDGSRASPLSEDALQALRQLDVQFKRQLTAVRTALDANSSSSSSSESTLCWFAAQRPSGGDAPGTTPVAPVKPYHVLADDGWSSSGGGSSSSGAQWQRSAQGDAAAAAAARAALARPHAVASPSCTSSDGCGRVRLYSSGPLDAPPAPRRPSRSGQPPAKAFADFLARELEERAAAAAAAEAAAHVASTEEAAGDREAGMAGQAQLTDVDSGGGRGADPAEMGSGRLALRSDATGSGSLCSTTARPIGAHGSGSSSGGQEGPGSPSPRAPAGLESAAPSESASGGGRNSTHSSILLKAIFSAGGGGASSNVSSSGETPSSGGSPFALGKAGVLQSPPKVRSVGASFVPRGANTSAASSILEPVKQKLTVLKPVSPAIARHSSAPEPLADNAAAADGTTLAADAADGAGSRKPSLGRTGSKVLAAVRAFEAAAAAAAAGAIPSTIGSRQPSVERQLSKPVQLPQSHATASGTAAAPAPATGDSAAGNAGSPSSGGSSTSDDGSLAASSFSAGASVYDGSFSVWRRGSSAIGPAAGAKAAAAVAVASATPTVAAGEAAVQAAPVHGAAQPALLERDASGDAEDRRVICPEPEPQQQQQQTQQQEKEVSEPLGMDSAFAAIQQKQQQLIYQQTQQQSGDNSHRDDSAAHNSGAIPSPPRHLHLNVPKHRRASSGHSGRDGSGDQWLAGIGGGAQLQEETYSAHSPSSVASPCSFASFFAEGSPSAVRAQRASAFSQVWPSSPLAGGLLRPFAPSVSVEIIDYKSLQIGRCLGRGAEGAVFEARFQDAPVAVKEGPLVNEIEIYLSVGSHDNVVGLRGLTQKDDGTWGLVLEYCGRGTLDTLLHHGHVGRAGGSGGPGGAAGGAERLLGDLSKLLPMARGIVRGMMHLHSRRPAILHRDLKPGNVFVGHGGILKIGDFGMSRQVFPPLEPPTTTQQQQQHPAAAPAADSDPRSGGRSGAGARSSTNSSTGGGERPGMRAGRTLTPGVVGTIIYSAPEVLDETLQHPGDSVDRILKADVYSFGVTLWEMVERRRPFEGVDGLLICAQWITNPGAMALPPLTVRPGASEADRRAITALQQLVTDCTAFDPDRRPSFKAVLDQIRRIQRFYEPQTSAPVTHPAAVHAPCATAAAAAATAVAAGREADGSGVQVAAGQRVPGEQQRRDKGEDLVSPLPAAGPEQSAPAVWPQPRVEAAERRVSGPGLVLRKMHSAAADCTAAAAAADAHQVVACGGVGASPAPAAVVDGGRAGVA